MPKILEPSSGGIGRQFRAKRTRLTSTILMLKRFNC